MKFINILAGITIIGLIPVSCNEKYKTGELKNAQVISARGNSWITNDVSLNGEMITQEGIRNWKDESTEIKTWFRTEKAGRVKIGMRARTINGKSAIICTLDDKSETVKISNQAFDTIMIGEFSVRPGYNALVLKGSSKADSVYAEVNDFFLTGEAVDGKTWFVKDDFYWGRRGPSVHLRYNVPAEAGNIKWFYNEITVPEGNDVSGSYFMADGFTDGYFGMQVNSETERRILFSVWSPYKTDNPGEIPEDQKIILLGKGEGVYTGEFGNEGSGGQSYYRYMWKAGNTYSFLLKGEPAVNNSTDYTAWFLAPETGEWKLIASFRRPQGSRYLGNLYSFLENFSTETGCITRSGYYSNQWVCNESGVWSELTDVKFTADATARKESRMDYSGGVENGRFFLKNCGFFSETTEMNTGFSRRATGTRPEIDLATFKTPASK